LDWTYSERRPAAKGCDRGKNGGEENTRSKKKNMIDELMEGMYWEMS